MENKVNNNKETTMKVPTDDFVLRHIFDCGQAFRWEENPDGSYTGAAGNHVARLSLTTDEDDPKTSILTVSEFQCDDHDEAFWHNYTDLDFDYGAVKNILMHDKVMQTAIPFGHGIRILRQDPWEATVSFIISQNNNIPRIKNNIRDLSRLAGEKICDHDGTEWYALPSPEKLASLTTDDLSPVRLGYRARYLIETAQCVCDRGMDVLTFDLDSLCGVGPKVASCIRLFGLGQIDSFPIDTWVKKVMTELYKIEKPSEMQKFARENFGEFGGIAQQYLFYYIRERDR